MPSNITQSPKVQRSYLVNITKIRTMNGFVLCFGLITSVTIEICSVLCSKSLNAIFLDMDPNTLKIVLGEDYACMFYLLRRSEALQFSDKLPYFTTDLTLECENSPVWHTFRFERSWLIESICVCGGGEGWKRGKTKNNFSSFLILSITGWNIPEAWFGKVLFKSHHIMETSLW